MNGKPTVIRVITWLPVGGIERRLVAVAPMLRDAGWNVRVVCIREEGPLAAELRDAGIPVDVVPLRSRLSPAGILALRRYFRRHHADVVHAHMYRSYIPSSIAARLSGVPVMLGQVHNVDSWDNARQAATDRRLAPLRTATLAVSRAVQRDVIDRLRLPESKVPVLYNGVDTAGFSPDAAAGRAVRAELGLAGDRLVFLVPARLHPQKNPLGVIEAFATAVERFDGPRPALLLAGDGKLRPEIEAEIARRDLNEDVLLLGARSDMPRIYNASDAVILSSFKEGFSNAVVEGLAAGKPVIASDVGGNAEAVSDKVYGWIHPPGDTAALASQMLQAMNLGREGLGGMATDCRRRAADFSLDALVRNTSELYQRYLAKGQSR